ncbi:MAG: hypothetical protein JSU05_00920 [Bacteroidetes bacterium]|nr:hypothetical protein [Bacteroidota bacterium]
MKKLLFFSLVLGFLSVTASAQQTQGNKLYRHRVANGYRSGELTKPEMGRIAMTHHHVKAVERRAGRDGHIGPMERRHIHHLKKHESRQVYRYKHNGRKRLS